MEEQITWVVGLVVTLTGASTGWLRYSLSNLRKEHEKDLERLDHYMEQVYAKQANQVRLEEKIDGLLQAVGELKDLLRLQTAAGGE